MAATSGTKDLALSRPSVEGRLFSEPYSFEFVQAVRLLRQFYPHRSPVGYYQPPRTEVVRFGARASLAFPASEVHELEERNAAPPLMRVNFIGTIGPLGVLPLYYTELVADRLMAKQSGLIDFLDIFHHRAISLFYRAWQKYRFAVAFEQGEGDDFTQYLLDLIGLGTANLQKRHNLLKDESLLFYAGLLSQQPRSAEALELLLQDYFAVNVRVEQFLGGWYRLDPNSQCNLDDSFWDSQQLGFGAVVGDEIWNQQSRIRLVLGPLTLNQYLDFLPSGTAYEPLRLLVRFFAGDEMDFEVQLILRHTEVPGCELGGTGDVAPQLGWVSWSKTQEMKYDPSETILQL
jgi:type VI secretion system protein ImpH